MQNVVIQLSLQWLQRTPESCVESQSGKEIVSKLQTSPEPPSTATIDTFAGFASVLVTPQLLTEDLSGTSSGSKEGMPKDAQIRFVQVGPCTML